MSRKRKGLLYIFTLLMLLIIFIPNHLGYSMVDSFLRSIGSSPWTNGDRSGLYVPGVVVLILIIPALRLAADQIRPSYPRIMSRLIIGCLIFASLYPRITEQIMILVKHNSSGIHSIAYGMKDSVCSYKSTKELATAHCNFVIYNYGKEDEIEIKPIFRNFFEYRSEDKAQLVFVSKRIHVLPNHKSNVGVEFTTEQVSPPEFISSSSSSQEVGAEITVDGVTKRYE